MMTVTTPTTERITITTDTVEEIKQTPVARDAALVLRTPHGMDVDLPAGVQEVLLQALRSIATSGSATISQVPEVLTSTLAAEMLGVSRPTLLKWAREGRIESLRVNTHTRFRRDDVLRFRNQRSLERREAVEALMAFDADHEEFLEG